MFFFRKRMGYLLDVLSLPPDLLVNAIIDYEEYRLKHLNIRLFVRWGRGYRGVVGPEG